MKVNDPNLQGLGGTRSTGGSTGVAKPAPAGRRGAEAPSGDGSDGVALSALAQSLRSLDVESPERQVQVESLSQVYGQGHYRVDAAATAGAIINDSLRYS